ncbi:WhiB family transcriptional regulator [Streptomyces antimycoticus]|uniref:WhiB family transcriptional regulator n=1 Tax=Streptomyces antimycoticus TaxID=68175 RepID=UPI0036B08381
MLDNSVFRRPNLAPDTLPRPEHWGKRAACRKVDPAVFFPEDQGAAESLIAEQAKGYCRRCPAVDDCLAEALQRGERFGVWGGLTAPERRALLRRRREEAKRGAEPAQAA